MALNDSGSSRTIHLVVHDMLAGRPFDITDVTLARTGKRTLTIPTRVYKSLGLRIGTNATRI